MIKFEEHQNLYSVEKKINCGWSRVPWEDSRQFLWKEIKIKNHLKMKRVKEAAHVLCINPPVMNKSVNANSLME